MPSSRHRYAVVAGLAGAGVTTLADAGVVAAAAVGVGFVAAALYWHRHDDTLRRRAVTATLTTVGALAAAGWGVVLGGGGRFTATPLSSALLVTATVGTGVAVLAGAGAGYYSVRLANPPADANEEDATASEPPVERPTASDPPPTDATVGDTPADEATVGDTPADEATVGDTPADEATVGDTPADEATVGDTPADEQHGRETAPGRADATGGRVAEQKRAFYFLNNLLRHHVLNGLNVVDGYAARLADDEADTERAAEVIRGRVATMTTVVGNVRAVADVFAGDPELTVTDVTRVATRVRERAADQHPAATVTVATDGPTEVWSAGGADAVVWELVDNGIVHNDGDAPQVHVRVTETDDAVWLHVADDGPGVDSQTETLLSPGTTGDQGLGLYLVATLVRYARGEVRVETPERAAALPGVTPGEDDRLAALLAADGTCVSLRLVPATADRPDPSPADRAVEHAIDRPEGGEEP